MIAALGERAHHHLLERAELPGEVGGDLARARRLLEEECGKRPAPELAPQVQEAILAHDWPGNVRELRNVLRYACALCDGDFISLDHLPASLRMGATRKSSWSPSRATL